MPIEHYGNWTGFAQVYLEDSYVLEIMETKDTLEFDMELVLREGHPAYTVPGAEEQYCYKRGKVVFRGVRDVSWHERKDVVSWDARGERDLGNIDVLCLDEGWFRLQGDWGRVRLHATEVGLEL